MLLPVYPVFGAIIYDGSNRDELGVDIDESSIIAEYVDVTDGDFIVPDVIDSVGRNTIEYYTIQSGDTLSDIAERYSISENTLRWANNLSSSVIRPGQQILIPPGDGLIYTTKK